MKGGTSSGRCLLRLTIAEGHDRPVLNRLCRLVRPDRREQTFINELEALLLTTQTKDPVCFER